MEISLFWTIVGLISVVNLAIAGLLFIPIPIFIISDIFNLNVEEKMEKKWPKLYKLWYKVFIVSFLMLLFDIVPFGIYLTVMENRMEEKEEVVKIIMDDQVKAVMESGKTYIIEYED